MKSNDLTLPAAPAAGCTLATAAAAGGEARSDRPTSQMAETARGPVEYARVGSGSPVLVVHGMGGGFDAGLGLADGFLETDFQVIAPSRFGYLRSPLPEAATPAAQADVFACLLDTLGIQKAAVLATSAGVTSALQFALRHPDRITALALHSPNAPGKVDMKLPPRAVYTALVSSDTAWAVLVTCFRPLMQYFVGVPEGFTLDAEMEKEVRAALRSVLPVSKRTKGMVFDTYTSNPDINRYPIEQVRAPALVVSALDDPMALHENARALAERLLHGRLLPVMDGGHLLLGHAAGVKAEISRFLRDYQTIF